MTPSDEPVADDPTVNDPASDRTFAAALTRATAEPPADLVARMQVATRPVIDETHPQMRRRWTVALVAASLLLVVGAGVLVARTGGDGGAGPADAPTLDGNYLPTELPAQLTSTISIGEVPATAMFGSWALLVRESTPDTWNVAGVAHLDHAGPLSQRNAQSDLDVWSVSDVIGGVDVTLYTRDSTLSAELEALLGQLTLSNLGEGRAPTLATVPDGWAWVPMLDVDAPSAVDSADAAELTAFTGWAQGGPGVGSAQRSSGDGRYRAGITTVRVADPQQVVEAIAALAGPSVSPVEIGEGVEGVIINQVTSSTGRSLVFAPEPGVVVVVTGRGISDDDLLALAGSSRPVDATEWDRFRVPEINVLPDSVCAALQESPAGLAEAAEANGTSGLRGAWFEVLSAELFRLKPESQHMVADAVRSDAEGFARAVDGLDSKARDAFEVMREVATGTRPIQQRATEVEVLAAADYVWSTGLRGCGFG